ncbi:MAG TPA: hypothetical protein VFU04_09825 [Solirubrobacterales bacterium]|nr:hypothetical protein [Solirubrobacterales bacterium]
MTKRPVGALAGIAMILLLAAPAARRTATTRDVVIDDGSGATIAVGVTPACASFCAAADPQQVASFVGTLIHGPEVELLTVQLETPAELENGLRLRRRGLLLPRRGRGRPQRRRGAGR